MATRKKPTAPVEDPASASPPETADTPTDDPSEPALPVDTLVRIYRKMTAKIDETKAAWEQAVNGLEAERSVIADALHAHMKEQNATSIKTPFGLVIRSKTVRYTTNDWDGFKTFIKEHDALDLMEKRIAQKNMADFRTNFPDLLPPGLDAISSYTITVRKPTK